MKAVYDRVLEVEEGFVRELDEYIEKFKIMSERRKEILHKKWSENVYKPLHYEINKEMSGPNLTSLSSKKCNLYKEYLEHVNKKVPGCAKTIALIH